MALQLRRGTNAERLLITPLPGELIFTTDTKKLYVGDGSTAGGVAVTSSSGSDLTLDALGDVGIINPTSGDFLKFTGVGWENNALTSADLADFNVGTPATGDFLQWTGSSWENNALTSADLGDFNVATASPGDFLQWTGSSWLSAPLSIDSDNSPSLGGNLSLNNFNITGTGNIDISGDFINNGLTINSNTLYSTLPLIGATDRTNNPVFIGNEANPSTLWIKSTNNFGVLTGITTGTNTAGMTFKMSRGTLQSPTAVQPGDPIAFIDALGYSSDYSYAGAFGMFADLGWDGTPGAGGQIPGMFGAVSVDTSGNTSFLTFDSSGTLSAPKVQLGAFATGSLPTGVAEGTMVFDTTTKQFKGWNGSAWVVLG